MTIVTSNHFHNSVGGEMYVEMRPFVCVWVRSSVRHILPCGHRLVFAQLMTFRLHKYMQVVDDERKNTSLLILGHGVRLRYLDRLPIF